MTDLSNFFAIVLGFFSGAAGGVCLFLIMSWTYKRMVLDHEYRLSDVEGRVNREVKIRAQTMAVKSRNVESDLLSQIKMNQMEEKPSIRNFRMRAFSRGAKDNGAVQESQERI